MAPTMDGVLQPRGVRAARGLFLAAGPAACAGSIAAPASVPVWAGPALLAAAVLASERLRLPLQNVVALGAVAAGAGLAAERFAGIPAPVAVPAAIVAVAGGRAATRVARRRLGTGDGWGLPLWSAVAALAAWQLRFAPAHPLVAGAAGWGAGLAAALVLQALLTPWWIDKRRVAVPPDPLAAVPWIVFAAFAPFAGR